MNFKTETPAQNWVRLTGAFYLAIIVIGALNHLIIRGSLIVPGDAIETARNILGAEGWWRLGIAGDIFMQILDLPVILVLFLIFKTVDFRAALLALLFNVIQTAVLVANKQNLILVSLLLQSGDPVSGNFHQAAEQAYRLIDLHNHGFSVGLIFFGISCCLYGYLIYRSAFLPKVLGIMMAIAGVSYLVSSFTLIAAPAIASHLTPILVLSLIGELSFALWLAFKGLKNSKPTYSDIDTCKGRI